MKSGKSIPSAKRYGIKTYWRLLSYVRPYWKCLTIGIVAGMLVGSSLFVTLLMIPQMVGVVVVFLAVAGATIYTLFGRTEEEESENENQDS